MILWLDHNHAAYWATAGVAMGGFIAWVLAAIWTDQGSSPGSDQGRSKWGGSILLFLLLLAWRWPFFFNPTDFNPDEAQIVAGAQALTQNSLFWKSVDGSTAGPINFYALLWVRLIGAPIDYFTARLTGLLLIWGSLLCSYGLLRIFHSRAPARLALLPVAIFFAIVTQDDFVHYSTEHVSVLLLSVATFLLVRRQVAERGGRLAWLSGGAILGLLPWAKLQSIPLAAALVLWLVAQLWRNAGLSKTEKIRRLRDLGLAGLAPSALFVALIVYYGVWGRFYHSYLLQNFNYVAESNSLLHALEWISRSTQETWHIQICMGVPLLAAVVISALYRPLRLARRALWSLGLVLVLAAVVAIIVPRRSFAHYLLFLAFPMLYWSAAALGDLWQGLVSRRSRWLVAGVYLAFGGLLPLLLRFSQPVPFPLDRLAEYRARPYTDAGRILRALARPGDRLGAWGWMCGLYVETGLYQATRGGYSYWEITESPQRDYYRALYLSDLKKNHPALFVDAVGPGAFVFGNREKEAHEIFPELAAYIQSHYTEVIDLEFARIYLRKDRVVASQLDPQRLRRLAAASRPVRDKAPPKPLSIASPQLPQNTIGGRVVRMMLPPAELSWSLDGTEREFYLHCGYDPRAYLEGQSNGTLFTAELTTPAGAVFPIYTRLLDPRGNQKDRGLVHDHFPLPPFPPGSRLTLKTSAGPGNDNAWDWAYLAGASVYRSPVYSHWQFPGFNRLPDSVTCDVAYLLEGTPRLALALHAPASLTFRLHGGESSLAFDCGFRAGAYSDGGRTDGAVFSADLRSPVGTQTPLLRRSLQPSSQTADQGNQHIEAVLPGGLVAGTELVLSISPGPDGNTAWDWTYLANLRIE